MRSLKKWLDGIMETSSSEQEEEPPESETQEMPKEQDYEAADQVAMTEEERLEELRLAGERARDLMEQEDAKGREENS